jgi:hypothetical protein
MFEVRIGGLSSASGGNKEPHPRLISCLMGISQLSVCSFNAVKVRIFLFFLAQDRRCATRIKKL